MPVAVRRYYETRAHDVNLSLDEYLAAKLVSEYLVEVDIEGRSVSGSQTTPGASNVVAIKPPNRAAVLAATRSGYKGVYAYGKRWAAVLYVDGKPRRIDVCDTPEDAARAYDIALITRAGGNPEAAVNFPTATDEAQAEAAPFIEKLATGALSESEWTAWGATPLPTSLPPKRPRDEEPDRTPLVRDTQPPKSLYRRGESFVDTLARTSPPLPPNFPEPRTAEPPSSAEPFTEEAIAPPDPVLPVEPPDPIAHEPTPPDPDE